MLERGSAGGAETWISLVFCSSVNGRRDVGIDHGLDRDCAAVVAEDASARAGLRGIRDALEAVRGAPRGESGSGEPDA